MAVMTVRLLFFAILRDITGTGERTLTLNDGTSARHVWDALRHEFPKLAAWSQPPMVAINESYAGADAILSDGDELAFIPPVAGG
jgi:molybdopterin converting factor subunit 1